jgi:hypothetical protein
MTATARQYLGELLISTFEVITAKVWWHIMLRDLLTQIALKKKKRSDH